MELKRADIGFGRVIVDPHGVTRRGLVRTHTLAWADVREYRLTIELHGQAPDLLYLLLDDLLTTALLARDIVAGYRGRSRIRLSIDLIGQADHVEFGALRFRGANEVIGDILPRIQPRLAAAARAELAAHGMVRFGPLALAPDAITWGASAPLPREDVESVELIDTSPARLRVMAKRKVLPYGQAATAEIPNLGVAFQLSRELGYPTAQPTMLARSGVST
jgi:hypothetical protein